MYLDADGGRRWLGSARAALFPSDPTVRASMHPFYYVRQHRARVLSLPPSSVPRRRRRRRILIFCSVTMRWTRGEA